MSRTDKDAPWWLGAEWSPVHSFGCSMESRACTLPAEPPSRPPVQKHVRRGPDDPGIGVNMRCCHWHPIGSPGRNWCGCWLCERPGRRQERHVEKRQWRQEQW